MRWPGQDSLAAARYPATEGPVRVDAALESGQVVSTAYDPMLGKVIARGPDRESARRALVAALDETAVLGLTTNVGFLRALAASEEFREATIDTAWLDRNTVEEPSRDVARVIAAWTAAYVWTLDVTDGHPYRADGWRLGADPAPVLVELDRPVQVDRARGLVHGGVDAADGPVPVQQFSAEHHTVVLGVDGTRHRAVVNVTAHAVEVVHRGQRHVFERPDVFGDHALDASDGAILAPMPGTVLDVRVGPGQEVAEGEVLGAMEAMKMELALKSPFAGTVTEVGAAAGDQVALGARLFLVEPHDADTPAGEVTP